MLSMASAGTGHLSKASELAPETMGDIMQARAERKRDLGDYVFPAYVAKRRKKPFAEEEGSSHKLAAFDPSEGAEDSAASDWDAEIPAPVSEAGDVRALSDEGRIESVEPLDKGTVDAESMDLDRDQERRLATNQASAGAAEQERCQAGRDGRTASAMRCPVLGCGAVLLSVGEYEVHYEARHRVACGVCWKSFPSSRLLNIHVAEAHDSFFQAKAARGLPVYECLVETCPDCFTSDRARLQHLIQGHQFPSSFTFHGSSASARHPSQKQRRRHKQQQQQHPQPHQQQKQHQHGSRRAAKQQTRHMGSESRDAESENTMAMAEDAKEPAAPLSEEQLALSASASSLASRAAAEEKENSIAVPENLGNSKSEVVFGRGPLSKDQHLGPAGQEGAGLNQPSAAAGASEAMQVDQASVLAESFSRLSCSTAFVPRQVCFGRRSQRGALGQGSGRGGSQGRGGRGIRKKEAAAEASKADAHGPGS